ncbi:hypothetical protein [Streptomyces sp. NPDC003522]
MRDRHRRFWASACPAVFLLLALGLWLIVRTVVPAGTRLPGRRSPRRVTVPAVAVGVAGGI